MRSSRHSSPPKHAASGGGRGVAMAAALSMALSVGAAHARQEPAQAEGGRPGEVEIARATETVRADPNLATERTIKTLRWKASSADKRTRTPAWLAWITGLFLWLDQSARLLVWGAVVALGGLLVVYIVRTARSNGMLRPEEPFVAPTHVRDLDIRPESLPEDVGAAARALWDRGEHRGALALLYRGMLSRLAHVHRIPIRDSSTEGDCLALATTHLPQGRREYASRLVMVWQRFVYGGQHTVAATVYGLCDDFGASLNGPSLDGASSLESTGSGSAA